MHTKLLFLIGAGGHGKVVFDALTLHTTALSQIRVRDAAEHLHGTDFLGLKIETPAISPDVAGQLFHLAMGHNKAREDLYAQLKILHATPYSVIHPMACVSHFAMIEAGVFVAAKAVVAPQATIGLCSIINHGAVIDHDCRVGAFSHIAPNATLGGKVTIGSHVLVGAGANILPGVAVANNAVIGAGAVVTTDVGVGETWVGVPAKLSRRS